MELLVRFMGNSISYEAKIKSAALTQFFDEDE